MREIGKLLFIAGIIMAGAGLLLWKTGGLGIFGRLPGDISVQRPGVSFYFPVTTCIVISIILTLLMWLFRR
jgi:membrane protein implicated in regulation of membrane protease activity